MRFSHIGTGRSGGRARQRRRKCAEVQALAGVRARSRVSEPAAQPQHSALRGLAPKLRCKWYAVH